MPAPAHAPGTHAQPPESLAPLRSRARAADRKSLGAFDTPPALARIVVERAIAPLLARRGEPAARAPAPALRLRIIDPSMGAGVMLVQSLRVLRAHGASHRTLRAFARRSLHGIDLDPHAVELARAALEQELGSGADRPNTWPRLRARDALTADELNGRFDAVVGNPPFVTSSRHDTDADRSAIAGRFSLARGNWDLCVPFVEKSLALLKPGGVLSLVLPRRLLASRYAASVRTALADHSIERLVDVPGDAAFDGARIGVFVLVLRRAPAEPGARITIERLSSDFSTAGESTVSAAEARALAGASWAPLLATGHGAAPTAAIVRARLADAPLRLADAARFRDGATTAQAYALAAHVREDPGDPGALRLVNTGCIDPFRLLWGMRPLRYLGRTFARPVVGRDEALRTVPHAARAAEGWCVLIAGMGARLEAAAAPPGTLCGKSAVLAVPVPGVCPFALAAYLNSDPVNEMYRALFGARGFGARSMTIGPRQVEQLPCAPIEELREGGALSELGREQTKLHAGAGSVTPWANT